MSLDEDKQYNKNSYNSDNSEKLISPSDLAAQSVDVKAKSKAVKDYLPKGFWEATRWARRAGSGIKNVSYTHGIHPGLVPGVAVEDRNLQYRTDKGVLAVAGALIVGFIAWGLISQESLKQTSSAILAWVVTNTGWLFSIMAVVVVIFMLMVAFSHYGNIPLGLDDEKPEYSFGSWVAMLFSAGMGIGLIFFGAYEPMTYFLNPPPLIDAKPGSYEALNGAMAQTMVHWGVNAWSFYALVGAAIAYGSFRRGRSPLLSRIFTPLLGESYSKGIFGRVVDIMAIVATLFGTAASLGIGATQIVRGTELATGIGPIGNAGLIAVITVLTVAFIFSAVSGVSKGIRWLSNINMVAAFLLILFIFLVGPTVFILDLIPSTIVNYIHMAPRILSASAAWGPEAGKFVSAWTVFYWAWWISWTPFVGMFIAKISRGRTLREFIVVVLMVPTVVCLLAFSIFGGTAMNMQMNGLNLAGVQAPEEMFFKLLQNLPLGTITPFIAMFCIIVFFVTSADSATVVMGTLSQQGAPEPKKPILVFWGLCLTGIAVVGLLIGKASAIQGLQNLIIVTALPFALVVGGIMVAFWRDLATDPYAIRKSFEEAAISNAVRQGIEEHGDNFNIVIEKSAEGEGVGSDFDSSAPEVTNWYKGEDMGQALLDGAQRVVSQNEEEKDESK